MQVEFINDSVLWEKVLNKFTYDFYHLHTYVEFSAQQENGNAALFVAREGENVFCLPLIVRPVSSLSDGYYDAISPYGYPGPLVYTETEYKETFVREALAALQQHCKSHGIISVFVRFHPILSPPFDAYMQYGCLVGHGETVSIDLTLSEEEMWRQIRYGHRSEIKKLQLLPYSVEIDSGWAYFEDFLQIYWQSMERCQADDYYYFSREYFTQFREALGEHLHLCIVKLDEQVACAGLFTEINGIVQYHLSGTKTDFMKQYPNKIMLDYVRRSAKERGNRYLHLGGGVGGQADSLFKFKAGFSKVRHSFYTWRAITDKYAYAEMVRQWEIKNGLTADGMDGFFPAYRKGV